jgi:hypothetical protein
VSADFSAPEIITAPTVTNDERSNDDAVQVPLDANPIIRAWRLASEDERVEFVSLFADDLRHRGLTS